MIGLKSLISRRVQGRSPAGGAQVAIGYSRHAIELAELSRDQVSGWGSKARRPLSGLCIHLTLIRVAQLLGGGDQGTNGSRDIPVTQRRPKPRDRTVGMLDQPSESNHGGTHSDDSTSFGHLIRKIVSDRPSCN